jgi:hypothetical protein
LLTYVAELLGEDEDWLHELSIDMFPNGCLDVELIIRAPRTMPVSTRDWLSVQMMAVFERDFPPGWLPFVHSTPLS